MAAKKVTEKKLRTLPAEYKGYVYQSNRLTNAKYDYSLIQERLFNALICKLQNEIKQVKDHEKPVQQLDLFKTDNIIVEIDLMAVAKPSYYDKVRKTVGDMATIKVEIPHVIKGIGEGDIITGLLAAWVPHGRQRSGKILVRIDRAVAELLVNIDHNNTGTPIHYTKYQIDVCLNARCKYTPRLYKYICSWKKAQGTYVKLDILRTLLQLDGKYENYKDFKKHVLIPVQKELKKIADCWFNFTPEKVGKNIVGLHLKIIEGDANQTYCKL